MNKQEIINIIKKWMSIILYVSIVFEIIFFPTLQNFCGCFMAFICWIIFKTFYMKKRVVVNHPFSFFMFLSMFLYRYLPLIATLTEGKPITYGFENPYETFFYETLLFVISSLAFSACISKKKRKNNFIQKILFKLNFYRNDEKILWMLGFIGLSLQLYLFTRGHIEYGDVVGKLTVGFRYLMYAPLTMLFPKLLRIPNNKRNGFLWLYAFVLFLISFATNSRQAMLAPFAIIGLLYFLYLVKENTPVSKKFSSGKIILIVFAFVFALNFLSDISLAMLATRSMREDVSKKELFQETIEIYQNDQGMQKLRSLSLNQEKNLQSYTEGWDETYINNFMLNRYGNMRISDQTLYYANKIGYFNTRMQDFFFKEIIALLPTPLIQATNSNIDKNELEYSSGDYLLMLATGNAYTLGGYRVTSHIGDGLATFGYWYFPIQFFLFFFIFKLLDCFVYYGHKGDIYYSSYGLMNVFEFLGMFRNANGCITDVSYCLRGFWQGCFTFLLVVFILRGLTNKKRVSLQ